MFKIIASFLVINLLDLLPVVNNSNLHFSNYVKMIGKGRRHSSKENCTSVRHAAVRFKLTTHWMPK